MCIHSENSRCCGSNDNEIWLYFYVERMAIPSLITPGAGKKERGNEMLVPHFGCAGG
jgi:hypothetical protein